MGPDDGYRLGHIEATAKDAATIARGLAAVVAVNESQLQDMRNDITELRTEVRDARAGVRTLVLALVGFALTVAGSAVGLALTLGGSPS